MLAVNVVPSVETASASGADDVAIWIHPTDTSKSTVIGAVKTSSTGIRVYNLAGQQIQSVASSQVNNIDLRYNFLLGGQPVALVTGSNRSNDSIVIFRVDPQTGLLTSVAARTISTGISIYGCAMYVSPVNGKYYTFVSSESGQVQQWELFDNGAGRVDAVQRRSFSVGSISEGLVADDVLGHLYVGQEDVGIWKYSAEPNGVVDRADYDVWKSNYGEVLPGPSGTMADESLLPPAAPAESAQSMSGPIQTANSTGNATPARRGVARPPRVAQPIEDDSLFLAWQATQNDDDEQDESVDPIDPPAIGGRGVRRAVNLHAEAMSAAARGFVPSGVASLSISNQSG